MIGSFGASSIRRALVLLLGAAALAAGCGDGTKGASISASASGSQSASASAATTTSTTVVSTDASSSDSGSASATTSTTTSTTTSSTTGVAGRVTAGPTCPVERPDQPCPPAPVNATVEALDGSGRSVARTATDDQGAFTLPLPPGAYTLRVIHDGPFPRCPDTPVTVTDGETHVDIDCDSGIR